MVCRNPRIAALLSLLATLANAQTTHRVGPGGFPQIQPAIIAAAPGDVIVVDAGVYLPFSLDKGLTLTAAPGALVQIASQTIATTTASFAIPIGQQADVVGLQFRNLAPLGFAMLLQVTNSVIHFSDCLFEGSNFANQQTLLLDDSDVVMHRCVVLAGNVPGHFAGHSGPGNDGLVVLNSRLAATESVFAGGHLHWDFIGGAGHGVRVVNSDVQLSHCIAIGGNNHSFNPGWPPGNGILVQGVSSVWLADCLLLGGHGNGGTGGTALVNNGTIPVQIARTQLGGGSGATPGGASTGAVVTAPLLGAIASGPFARGQVWQARFTANPGEPITALLSTQLAPAADPRALQPVWFPANSSPVFVGVTNTAGVATFVTAIPNDPALLHAKSWLHPFAGTALPVQGAPPLGGAVR